MLSHTFSTLALAASIFHFAQARPTKTAYGTAPTSAAKSYKQIAEYSHPNFFDGFTPFTGPDPTWGFIDYVDTKVAKSEAMMGWILRESTNKTSAFVGVDATGVAPNGRQSVRLTSNKIFEIGTLTVIDVLHMPSGAGPGGSGLWPAVWYLAPEPSWPYGGEQDIIEYVNPSVKDNGTSFNAMTLHTGPGCLVESRNSTYLGELQHTDCSFSPDGNVGSYGCSVTAPLDYQINGKHVATAGPDFNAQGGGVYVHEWTKEGIAVWLFTHESLPSDIKNGHPDPSSWKQKPLARFAGSGCDFSTMFAPQQLIINIDVCGQWAGEVFPGGQEACNAFAANNPNAFKNAYFEFADIKMYSRSEI